MVRSSWPLCEIAPFLTSRKRERRQTFAAAHASGSVVVYHLHHSLCWSRTMRFLSALALVALASAPLAAAPNVVVILADDVGYGDLGCYGATKIKTPHLDALAKSGMRFTNAHSPAAVCTPTRYALMTG